MRPEIRNSKGELIVLNDHEAARAAVLQQQFDKEYRNALGYEIDLTTLTQILSRVIDQKFYQISPAQYLPVRVGEGPWSEELLTYRNFSTGGDFETGILNTGTENSRLAEVSAAVDAVRIPVLPWAKQVNWSLFDLKFAARSGNWDVVTSKEKSRKMNWDLGIQRIAFLGSKLNSSVKGLLTQSTVNSNTSLIQEYISTMDVTEFQTLVAGFMQAYRANADYTAYPDTFTIPEADYNGLAGPVSPTYPVNSKLQYLLEAFKTITNNPNFQIKPLAYANKLQNATVSGLNKNRYTLYRQDEDSVRMDIPVDYTSTLQNSLNNFNFQSVAFGQFTGVQAYRPQEMLYFDWG